MTPPKDCSLEKILINTIHDVRQPLGAIEASVYLLNHWLCDAPENVREQLRLVEQQVDLAASILTAAARNVPLFGRQPAAEESFDPTNSETALVT